MTNFFVFDTNTLISAVLLANSRSALALERAFEIGILAISDDTLNELAHIIFRKKFDRYLLDDDRWRFINEIEQRSRLFSPNFSITDCRDPKDNKFLELAIAAKSSCIITGDTDLLVLHPFRNIPILNASDFLSNFKS